MSDPAQDTVGIFGGSFSPPHMGHVLACHYALLRWKLKSVFVVPSFTHPFGKALPPFELRMAMCHLAFAHLGSNIEISDIERQMGGVSYTIDTVQELKRQYPAKNFRLLVGGDILDDTKKWRNFNTLRQIAPLLIIPRISEGTVYGGSETEAALPDVSSTMIRRKLASCETVTGAVPEAVLEYVIAHGLYSEHGSPVSD